MAEVSTWEKFKAVMTDGAPKGNTQVKELDAQKVAGFQKGFSGGSSGTSDAMKRRLQKLTGSY